VEANEIKMTKLYVGNISYEVTERELHDAFAAHAAVDAAELVRDRASGHPKGFGFVTLAMESDAAAAVEAMNNTELRGRKLRVEIAKPRDRGNGHGSGGRNRMY